MNKLTLHELGQGSYAKVYKAFWRGTAVAAKVLPAKEPSVYRFVLFIMPRCTMVHSCVGPSVHWFLSLSVPVCQISHIFVRNGFKVLKIGQHVIIDILMR